MIHFLDEAQELFQYTRDVRRDLHMHPEIGFMELRTADVVAQGLTRLGMEVQTKVGQTGVVGMLEGKGAGRVILLRFDMDALPITEETGAEYASLNHGVMHACGHDAHVAIGLSVARILDNHKSEFNGRVKLVFQPAEEGQGGAAKMIEDGILQDPRPDLALALHIWNEKPGGWIGITPGPVMAAADKFTIKIQGKGGHGAVPNLSRDPVVAAAQVINLLQGIVSRNVSPLKSAVVTVASVHGGEAFNVIPSTVELEGTLRTFETDIRDLVIKRLYQVVENVARAEECEASIEVQPITRAVVNDPGVTSRVQQVASRLLVNDQLDFKSMTMGSEDMALVLEQVPGCYFFIGSANAERKMDAPHHHPKFDFDESILPKAVGLMAATTYDLLEK